MLEPESGPFVFNVVEAGYLHDHVTIEALSCAEHLAMWQDWVVDNLHYFALGCEIFVDCAIVHIRASALGAAAD